MVRTGRTSTRAFSGVQPARAKGKGEKKSPRPHGDAPAMNVSVFDIGNLEAGVGSVNFKVGSVNFM